jgi:predicted ATP-grasp superfamily ATP-dependent carboligase
MAVLAVAGLSARMLAEAAARDGYEVMALDLFGDADTRRAAAHWVPIGPADGALQFDGVRVLDALRELSQRRNAEVLGWIAGSGFEGRPDLLEAGASLLPLIGCSADAVRRVRDPQRFFGALAAHRIGHPAVQWHAPAGASGWLSKDARASGGWHIRHAADRGDAAESAGAARYFQREMHGTPMSATFIANGRGARLLGFNELIVRAMGARPHVYCGCIGPVSVAPEVVRRMVDAAHRLAAAFDLRGWCSLDFIRDGDALGVLEVNPRPPASLALYAQHGLVDAQLRACLHRELPPRMFAASRRTAGHEIVYAARALQVDEARARQLAAWPGAHDLPTAGTRIVPGEPLCSLSAEGHGAAQVRAILAARRDALLDTLETWS